MPPVPNHSPMATATVAARRKNAFCSSFLHGIRLRPRRIARTLNRTVPAPLPKKGPTAQ